MQIFSLISDKCTHVFQRLFVLILRRRGNFAVEGAKEDKDGEAQFFGELFDAENIVGGRLEIDDVPSDAFEIARVHIRLRVFFGVR